MSREAKDTAVSSNDQSAWVKGLDRVLAVQRPAVVAYVRGVRKRHPGATPDQLVRVLERRYLAAITAGGAAVGATAMVPAIGTGVTLALSGVETAGFLETTALFAQSVAEVHGVTIEDPVRARALVMSLMLGRTGSDLVKQFTGQAMGQGPERKAFWGEMVSTSIPQVLMGPVVDELKKRFLRKFAVNHGASLIGKAAPFGIGAAIGGVGNNMAGRQVVSAARTAFGPAPYVLPLELETIEDDRTPRRKLPFVRRRAVTAGPVSPGEADASGFDELSGDDTESVDRR
ncbi:hypothetical protein ELQ90_13250 [Labedella phragmitis]|uniref:Di-and tripeptidase n=1 Tax=Labedella phragmitis TaxID=2498849 RepID=A0A3S4BGR8_9MICO|nr:hypothetical protein [Labedella phragmitis]RWZ49708.1 hypothetical protein ELQ90_13250 [Labedella phragmitis]